jgi:hypothetical protein
MQKLGLLFSPTGRLRPQVFIVIAIAVYVAGVASHVLTMPDVIGRFGLWPFLAVQALLIWIWFVVHAKRLSDAGRGTGFAAAVSVLYTLSIALLVIVAASFYSALAGQVPDANSSSALGLILLVWIIAVVLGAPQYDLAWLMVAILLFLALVPPVLAVATTVWAATRPSVAEKAA